MLNLIQSKDEFKERYFEIIDEISSYKKIKQVESFKKVRIYSGRRIFALLVFKGKTLCLAMDLDITKLDKIDGIDNARQHLYWIKKENIKELKCLPPFIYDIDPSTLKHVVIDEL